MKAAIALLGLLGLAGCPALKHHAVRNAPGNVELDLAPVRETGDPAAFEPPSDPGEHRMGIAPGLFVGPASGRLSSASGHDTALELGMQVHLSFQDTERSSGRDAFGYPPNAWGASIGWAFFQSYQSRPTVMGPVYLEATRHVWLASLGAGVAVYPTPGKVGSGSVGGVDAGAQVTLGAWPFMLRMRWMQDTGFEIAGVIQIELPLSVTWSR